MTTKLTTSNLSAETLTAISGPRISNVKIADSSYNTLDDTAANISGGFIIINGQNFISNCQVLIDNTPATTVTFVSNSVIRAQVPASAEGTTKSIYVVNPDGSSAIIINGLTYSAFPAWSTGSTLTSFEALVPVSIQLSAPSATVYTLAAANTLPSSLSLYANGLIAGTVAANTTTNYNFTVNAKDAENQDTNRNFTLPITQNVEPAWVTAADLGSASVDANYSNTLVATDLSNVTYSVAAGSSLPSSLTLAANGLLSGNVSAANTYSFGIVATDTANLSNTRTFSITISVAADAYFKNTTLLLNGETTVTPFISDASTNSFPLTINGDTKPVLFNPYTPGYYSNYFDGTGDYLTAPSNIALNLPGDFTIEFWVYPTASIGSKSIAGTTSSSMHFDSSGYFYLLNSTGQYLRATDASFLTLNTWTHVSISRSGSTLKFFRNGIDNGIAENVGSASTATFTFSGLDIGYSPHVNASSYLTGYISNFRIVKGTAVYTSAFTPSTTPLTAIANTSLLTCQSNRLIDNSTNAFTIAKNGDTLVSPNIPFTQNSSYSTYGSTYFDGTGDYIKTSSNSGLAFGTGDFTIECWVFLAAGAGANASFFTTTPDTTYNGVIMGRDVIGISGPGGTGGNLTGVTIASNTWTHVALTRSGTSMRVFFNGVQQGSTATNSTNINSTLGTIGSRYVEATGYLWLGYISDLRILKGTALYTTTFTPPTSPLTAIANTQLLTLQYNGGATNQGIIDNSNFNNIITRNGNTSQGTFSPYSVTGWSNYFDGTGDYLTPSSNTPMDFGTGNFTIEGWFLTGDKSISGGANRMIIGNSGNSYTMHLYIDSSGFLTFGNTSATFIRGSTDLANNSWNHFAIVRSGTGSGQIKMYVNGVEVASGTNNINYVSGTIFIGAFGASDGFWNGYISNLRIIKGTALYTTTFTPSTTPLTPITNTQLLTCQSNRFIDNSPNSFTLTRTGDVSVQALDPFGSVPEAVPISYSNYFDGTGDDLTTTTNAVFTFGTGDFTIEMWVYVTANPGDYAYFYAQGPNTSASMGLYLSAGKINVWNGSNIIVGSTTYSLNRWYHVALSRTGTSLKLFLDGVQDGSATNSSNITTGSTYGSTVARWVEIEDSRYFAGYISNLRVVKGTAVYTTTFTPSTTPLTAIANTSLLTCQSTRMIDNSTNAFTITAAGDVKPRIFNPFGYTEQTYTSYTPSIHGGSAYFDGTGDYLSTPDSTVFTIGSNNFTFECWVYPTSITNGNNNILAQWGNGNAWIFRYVAAGRPQFSGGATNVTGTTTAVVVNQWNHIAITRTSTTVRLFVNGILDATTGTVGALTDGASQVTIGAYSDGTSEYVTGYISDLRLINGTSLYTSNFVPPTQTLTNYSTNIPAQLLLNFNNGGIIDQHGTNVLETLGNAQLSTAVKKYGNASMYFDGTGDYLYSVPNINYAMGSGDFTIELWYYPITHTNTDPALIGNYNATFTTNKWTLHAPHASYANKYSLWVNNYAAGSAILVSTSTMTDGAWVHIAITRSGSTWKMFINGTVEATTTSSVALDGGTAASMDGLYVGANFYSGAGGRHINAYIDDLRITKGVARYTTTFTPPTSAFIAK